MERVLALQKMLGQSSPGCGDGEDFFEELALSTRSIGCSSGSCNCSAASNGCSTVTDFNLWT
jgi:hypothetical protein